MTGSSFTNVSQRLWSVAGGGLLGRLWLCLAFWLVDKEEAEEDTKDWEAQEEDQGAEHAHSVPHDWPKEDDAEGEDPVGSRHNGCGKWTDGVAEVLWNKEPRDWTKTKAETELVQEDADKWEDAGPVVLRVEGEDQKEDSGNDVGHHPADLPAKLIDKQTTDEHGDELSAGGDTGLVVTVDSETRSIHKLLEVGKDSVDTAELLDNHHDDTDSDTADVLLLAERLFGGLVFLGFLFFAGVVLNIAGFWDEPNKDGLERSDGTTDVVEDHVVDGWSDEIVEHHTKNDTDLVEGAEETTVALLGNLDKVHWADRGVGTHDKTEDSTDDDTSPDVDLGKAVEVPEDSADDGDDEDGLDTAAVNELKNTSCDEWTANGEQGRD